MKRSPMPPRRTPLKRSRMKPTGAKARREADAIAAFRLAIHARSGGFCEADTPACPPGRHEGTDCHHLAPSDRDRGLHDPERGLLLCRAAHRFTHDHPELSYRSGLLIRDGVAS